MGKALVIVFLLVLMAYLIAVFHQYREDKKDVRLYLESVEKEELARQIEAVQIPPVAHWREKAADVPGREPGDREGESDPGM